MVYMFNELSLSQVNSVEDARNVLEIFVKSSIRAKEYGLTEIRLHESLQNIYQLNLLDGYRIDNWLNDADVNSDLQDKFRDIVSTTPLIKTDEISEIEDYARSEFHKTLDEKKHQVFGLGAAHIYGTLAASLTTHAEWSKPSVSIHHYSINHDGTERNIDVDVFHFSSEEVLKSHNDWILNEQKESFEKSSELWNRSLELLPNILLGQDLEEHLMSIGLTKKFNQVFECLKKVNDFAGTWKSGAFALKEFTSKTGLDISGESEMTMKKYSTLRKFRLSTGEKVQFELHIKLGDTRIYILPDELSHKIIVGYFGKHIRTVMYD